jgi:hypothetical protein
VKRIEATGFVPQRIGDVLPWSFYRLEGLSLRLNRRTRRAASKLTVLNDRWAMDFVTERAAEHRSAADGANE